MTARKTRNLKKPRRTWVRLPVDVHEDLKAAASARNLSLAHAVELGAQKVLARAAKKQKPLPPPKVHHGWQGFSVMLEKTTHTGLVKVKGDEGGDLNDLLLEAAMQFIKAPKL